LVECGLSRYSDVKWRAADAVAQEGLRVRRKSHGVDAGSGKSEIKVEGVVFG
jgi:hypothetical protein